MYDIVGKRNLWFAISAVLTIPGIIFILLGGLKPSIDFTGGTEWEVRYADEPTAGEMTAALSEMGYEDVVVTELPDGFLRIRTEPIDLIPPEPLEPSGSLAPSDSAAASATPGVSETPAASASPDATGTAEATGSPLASASAEPTASPEASPSPEASASPTAESSPSAEPTPVPIADDTEFADLGEA